MKLREALPSVQDSARMRELLTVRPRGGVAYPVLVGTEPAAALAEVWDARWTTVAVLGDANTLPLFGAPLIEWMRARGCRVVPLSFPAGEAHKTRRTKERLEDAMLAAGVERSGCLVAVGGGVALDLAGFVAATYLRGIAHVFVATSLVAQVDAAIGGKTGVNTHSGKNLVGAFHHPRAVFIDIGALASLPRVELESGLAETLKHAVVRDAALFEEMEAWADDEARATLIPPEEVIARSVAIKAEVVAEDERDHGVRNILNYGHTVAHALEAATNYTLSHGHAVAIGMVVEARLGATEGWLPRSEVDRIGRLATRLGLPTAATCAFELAAPYFAADKKTQGGIVRCAVPSAIGRIEEHAGAWTRPVSLAQLAQAWS
ncbi:MAG: 3-dehydroquinate synthase [Myxococcales bacterium]|nr:3-dehydroquinate synthase [Myxococcales bacterium]